MREKAQERQVRPETPPTAPVGRPGVRPAGGRESVSACASLAAPAAVLGVSVVRGRGQNRLGPQGRVRPPPCSRHSFFTCRAGEKRDHASRVPSPEPATGGRRSPTSEDSTSWLRGCSGWSFSYLQRQAGSRLLSVAPGRGGPLVITCEVSEPAAVPAAHLSLPSSFGGWFLAPLLSVFSPSSPRRAFWKVADGHGCHTGHSWARAVPGPRGEILLVTFRVGLADPS